VAVTSTESRPATVAAPTKAGRVAVVNGLSLVIAVGAAIAAAVGLFATGGAGPVPFITVRGETVDLYGRGLYRYDTLFAAGGAHGNDAVLLLLGIPLLLLSTVAYRRGGLRGRLLHVGVLVYFLYTYASLALGTVAFNPLFPLFVAVLSASLFATALAISTVDLRALAGRIGPATPRRGLAAFLFASGAVTLAVWGLPLLTAVLAGEATERLDSYTTEVTFALDLATITPLLFVAAVTVLWRRPAGYLIAVALLTLEVMLAPMIIAQTIGQLDVGVTLSAGEIIGPLAGFVVLAAGAACYLIAILRHLTEERP
jgi:hypothetical protein